MSWFRKTLIDYLPGFKEENFDSSFNPTIDPPPMPLISVVDDSKLTLEDLKNLMHIKIEENSENSNTSQEEDLEFVAQDKDDVNNVARIYGLNPEILKEANNLISDEISPGMQLIIPVSKKSSSKSNEINKTQFECICYYCTAEGLIIGILNIKENSLDFQAAPKLLKQSLQHDFDFNFNIDGIDMINAFSFKLPADNFESIEREYAENYFIEIQVCNTGFYPKAKNYYKTVINDWKKHNKYIAKLVLKVYPWRGNLFLLNSEKEEISNNITKKMIELINRSKSVTNRVNSYSEDFITNTNIPYYDINFEVCCDGDVRYDYEKVEQNILLYENVYGVHLKNFTIADFKNHSFHPISELFAYALDPKRKNTRIRKTTVNQTQTKPPIIHEEVKHNEVIKPQHNVDETPKKFDYGSLLSTSSEVIEGNFIQALSQYLPGYLRKTSLTLLYSTGKHGINLHTIYRECEKIQKEVLLVLKDGYGNVCGGFLTDPLQMTGKFYGTGECFVFSYIGNKLQVYSASMKNNYFIFSNEEGIGIGAEPHPAIWIDGDLLKGETKGCLTFCNPKLLPDEYFEIKRLEVWTFNLEIR